MFTGLVSALGRIESVSEGDVRRMTISSPYPASSIDLGSSIAHAGVCLTVVARRAVGEGSEYDLDVSPETLSKTTLGEWTAGDAVNLERALKVGDELGGHIVQGHVDGVGRVVSRSDEDGWIRFIVKAPTDLSAFIAYKGSITVDGVSLTVNRVEGDTFELMIIPHTAEVTTLGSLQAGTRVNLEVDVMARYAARLMEARADGAAKNEVQS
ncbi:riboflavin synthase [Oceanicaulis alexandrii]|uniref:riboflavin synthase n=1 Tax=Oceanicaulis alexandrii TaxID=153233 RepID=UPI0023573861|nr:riboflavin synthase [Oceanicaulis alexandrii]